MSSTVVEQEKETSGNNNVQEAPKNKKKLTRMASKNSYYFGSMLEMRSPSKAKSGETSMKKVESLPAVLRKQKKTDDSDDDALIQESSFTVSAVKAKGGDSAKLKKNRKGKHHVKIEVIDGFIDTDELQSVLDSAEDSETEEEEGESSFHQHSSMVEKGNIDKNKNTGRTQSLHEDRSNKSIHNRSKTSSGYSRSFSKRLATGEFTNSSFNHPRIIYYCEVIYDGVSGQSVYGEDNIKIAEGQSYRKVLNKSKTKVSTSWRSVHTINVQKVASDIGVRFLIIKVKKKNTNSVLATVDSTIGSFRVPLGGLRQNKTVDNWYVITKPPGVGKVRLKLTYKCTLPMHNTKGNSGKKKARLLVHTPPYMYEYVPVEKSDQLYTKHIFDIQKNDEQKNSNIETNGEEEEKNAKHLKIFESGKKAHMPFHSRILPFWPSPLVEVVEEVYDDVCLVGGKQGHDNERDILVSGALVLSSYRLIFIPHRAAFRKGSRQENYKKSNSLPLPKATTGYKQVEHLEIPLGWIMDMSLVDGVELGPVCPAGTLLEIKCKLPGMYYFHLGAKTLKGDIRGPGCCGNPFVHARTIEEVSLEQLTYSPEILLENLVLKMEWLIKEQQSRLFKGKLITEVEENNISDSMKTSVSNPLLSKKQLAKSMFHNNLEKVSADANEGEKSTLKIDDSKINADGREDDSSGEKEQLKEVEEGKDIPNDGEDDNSGSNSNNDVAEEGDGKERDINKEEEGVEEERHLAFTYEDDATRLGFRQHGWRIYEQLDFHLCKSYPSSIYVPTSMTDEDVKQLSKYRSRGRIPAIVWRHPYTGAVVCRCAQPLSGLTSKSSTIDKKMLLAISECSHSEANRRSSVRKKRDRERVLEVVNTFSTPENENSENGGVDNGKKKEPENDDKEKKEISSSNKRNDCPRIQGKKDNDNQTNSNNNINDEVDKNRKLLKTAMSHQSLLMAENDNSETLNIMDMRPLLNVVANKVGGKGTEKIRDYSLSFSMSLLNVENIHVMRRSLQKLMLFGYQGNWEAGIKESKWLTHVTMLLVAAVHGVKKLDKGISILVHCSDGWDRTPQATALTMLMVDPFYRTIQGFLYLIQNQWCDFGHKFFTRQHSNGGETGPIFVQFMDCVYQLMEQFPNKFQFTQDLLIFIIDHSFSGWFFTFLGNTMKDRLDAKEEATSRCVFQVIFEIQEYFKNENYVKNESRVDVLDVHTSPQDIKLWLRFYGRALHSARKFSHKIKKPRFVTRLLHRKIMRKMLGSVLNGVRPSSRAKRTSLFLGGHLTISRLGRNNSRTSIQAHSIHQGSVSFRQRRRRGSSVNKNLQTMNVSPRKEEEFTNQGSSNGGGKSCVVM